ncbi:MAG: hypothetical protein LBD08_04770 [Treponema sp.]|jgi:hypothetical protein|nr:hypothetical protein [Treponema sp.]
MQTRIFARAAAVLVLMGMAFCAYAEGDGVSIADKLHLSLDFSASILSVDSEGVIDSMADAGFWDDGTEFSLSYDNELWGGTASLVFGDETLRIFNGEIADMLGQFPLSIGELYAWIQPFGGIVKFTGGVFENTDGIADYTDDIDNFGMGVFIAGEDGEPFSEPEDFTNTALTSGLLTDLMFGPLTVQLLLAPNYSKESASDLASGYFSQVAGSSTSVDAGERFFRLGGRVIIDAGVGTVAVMAKTFRWPIAIMNAAENPSPAYEGVKADFTTFGAYFDLTAVENLGVSLGYTGFLPYNDADGVDNILWSGIDLRAAWTGIAGLSLSTHHNISFAQGTEKDWLGLLPGDGSFLTLYNAIGATAELNEKFSVNAEIANVFSKTDTGGDEPAVEFDSFWAAGKLITRVNDNAEFSAGLRIDISKSGDDDMLTVFSIPIGITVSF